MKRLAQLFLGLAVMLGLSTSLFAQTDPVTGQTGPWIYFGGGYTATAGNSSGDYGAGLYSGTLTATKPVSPTGLGAYQFICDDFDDEITAGEYWEANQTTIYNLSGVAMPNAGDKLPYTGDNQLQSYAEALWLAQDLIYGAKNGGSAASDAGAVSWAIWTTMDSPGTLTQGSANQTDVTNLLNAANSWWNTCNSSPSNLAACEAQVSNINIYTPVANSSDWINPVVQNGTVVAPQEFFGAATPEPVSMALMGTFLTLAGFALGRKKLLS